MNKLTRPRKLTSIALAALAMTWADEGLPKRGSMTPLVVRVARAEGGNACWLALRC
jgi:hypothetical protein